MLNFRKSIIPVFILLIISVNASAQYKITGKVIDSQTHEGLIGVNIIIPNTNQGTTTDANSQFILESDKKIDSIIISFVGYKTKKIKAEKDNLIIKLEPLVIKLQDVVITATKTERLAIEVPAKVSVIKSEEIENSPIVYADEALKNVSGLYLSRSNFSDVLSKITIRGFSGKERTLVLLDGQPLNDGYTHGLVWSVIPTNIIDRIEVIRGPFSCLYGGNAMGGVINVITKNPEKEAIYFRTGYGTYNTFTSHLGYSNKLTKKKNIGVYLSWDKKYSEGYASQLIVKTASAGTGSIVVTGWEKTKDITGKDCYLIGDKGNGYWNQDQYFGKITWDISPKTNLNFTCNSSVNGYEYKNPQTYLVDSAGNSVYNGTVTIIDNGVNKKISITPYLFLQGTYKNFSNSYKLKFNTLINKIKLTSYVGLIDNKNNYITPASGANEYGGPAKINITSPNRYYTFNLQADIPVKKHVLTIGTDYRLNDVKCEEWNISDWQDKESKTVISTSMQGKQYITAGFAQLELNLHKKFKAYLGTRFDYWKNYEGENFDAVKDTLIKYNESSKSYLSPKIGLVYMPKIKAGFWELSNIRVSAGNAFRPPTLYNMYKTIYYSTKLYESNPDLKPEITKSWDAGVEQLLFNGKTKINVDYYENYIENLIYNKLIEVDHLRAENAGKGEVKGIEIEIKQYFTSWLDGYFNITDQKTKITENAADTTSIGKQFLYVPNLIYNTGISFHKGPMNISLGYHFSEKPFSKGDNSDTEKCVYGAYDEVKLLDGKISYNINKNMNIALSVNNILDTEYFVYYMTPGRTFTINLSAKF